MLPPVIANTLVDGFRLITGTLLLLFVAAAWLCLMSWSLDDPSLSHATSQPSRNWLGGPGAFASDLLIQMFGAAAIALLLPPMFWGMALIQREALPWAARRLSAYVGTVMAIAAAASSIPAFAVWPLHHGLGGIVGDAGLLLVSAPLQAVLADWGRPVAGGLMAIFGFWCAGHSIAVSGSVVSRAVAEVATLRLPSRRTVRNPTGPGTTRTEPSLPRMAPAPVAASDDRDLATPPRHRTRSPARSTVQFGPYAAYEPLSEPGPDEDEFDEWTNSASSGIAARFAPVPGNTPRALQETLMSAFTTPPLASGDGDDGGEGCRADHDMHSEDPESDHPAYEILRAGTASVSFMRPPARAITYKRPSLNLLERPKTARTQSGLAASILRGNARLLEDVLAEFGVVAQVSGWTPGPVVTVYEVEAARGTNPARVVALGDEIARGMGVPAVRIAPIAGRAEYAFELPNPIRETVYLRDIFEAEAYRSTMDALPVALGKSASGEPVVADLARLPHLLLAGAPGAGQSAGINAMILSLVYKHGPENCRFLMIDANMVELQAYDGIPHLLTPVVTDPHKAITALAWCVSEMEERYKRMAALGVRTIDVFNNRVRNAKKRGDRLARTVQTGFDDTTGRARFEKEEMSLEPLPYIVIVIEEFADLVAVAGREIEGSVKRLAEAARAAGIHLIMATERPSADIVTPAIRNSMSARLACRVSSRLDSRTLLGTEGAESLLGAGDMLYATGPGQPQRVHGPFVSAEEIETIAGSLRQQPGPGYVEGITGEAVVASPVSERTAARAAAIARHAASEDSLYDRAVAIVVRDGRASSLQLQRRLNIQPAWAEALLARLGAEGIVAPADARGDHALLAGAAA